MNKGKTEIKNERIKYVSARSVMADVQRDEYVSEDFLHIIYVADLPNSYNTLCYAPGENLKDIFEICSLKYKQKYWNSNPFCQVRIIRPRPGEPNRIFFRRDIIQTQQFESDDDSR